MLDRTGILHATKRRYHDNSNKKIGGPVLRQAANLFSTTTYFNRLSANFKPLPEYRLAHATLCLP